MLVIWDHGTINDRHGGPSVTLRDRQREATRAHILAAAVGLLVEHGHSALTTVAVQRRAEVSRGALLHHFPTMADLMTAVIEHLVMSNEQAAREIATTTTGARAPVARAINALYAALSTPEFLAELELWAAARTDDALRAAIGIAERNAGRDLRRVVDSVFGPQVTDHANYHTVSDLTVVVLRGLAIAQPLRRSERGALEVLASWAAVAEQLLTA